MHAPEVPVPHSSLKITRAGSFSTFPFVTKATVNPFLCALVCVIRIRLVPWISLVRLGAAHGLIHVNYLKFCKVMFEV